MVRNDTARHQYMASSLIKTFHLCTSLSLKCNFYERLSVSTVALDGSPYKNFTLHTVYHWKVMNTTCIVHLLVSFS